MTRAETSFVLGPGELRVRYAFTAELARPALRERCLALLSEAERARQARFRFARDQDSYLLAHALVRGTLAALLGEDARALQFEDGEHGRPELVTPQTTPRVRFNLSHTEGLVACAFALEHDVGVDVEHVDRRVEIAELSKSVFSPSERERLLGRADEHARRQRFFELWTLKEAYIKAVGKGLALPLRAISFELDAGELPTVAFAGDIADAAERWALHVHPIGERHMLASALGHPEVVRHVEQCDLERL
jgi:4'-phosphopantetheinyl transferase